MKVDITKVLLDYESEDQIPEGEDRIKKLRYQLTLSVFNVPAKVANTAAHFKWCCCNAY